MSHPRHEIERIPDMDPQTFARYRRAQGRPVSRPVILEGAARRWPAWGKWDFDWFTSLYGDAGIPVESNQYRRQPDGAVIRAAFSPRSSPAYAGVHDIVDVGADGAFARVRLGDFVRAMRGAEARSAGYIITKELFQLIPSLDADAPMLAYAPLRRLTERAFFMGPAGIYTQLHMDRAHNLHAMLRGRKRWQLYAPARSAALAPIEFQWHWMLSGLDLPPAGGSADTLPGGVEADYDFVLEAGDILFVPHGWWHRVETVSDAIATNLWWLDGRQIREHGRALAMAVARTTLRNLGSGRRRISE